MKVFFDGWYFRLDDAKSCLKTCIEKGGIAVGFESWQGRFGFLHIADRVIFDNHVLDGHYAVWAPIRYAAAS